MKDLFENATDLAVRLMRECVDAQDSGPSDGLIQTAKEAADLLEHQAYIILGIMHSVDKWLDGVELEQDEVNRAATMREKILGIIESRPDKIHAHIIVDWLGNCRCSHCGYDEVCYIEPYCEHCGAHFDEPVEKED